VVGRQRPVLHACKIGNSRIILLVSYFQRRLRSRTLETPSATARGPRFIEGACHVHRLDHHRRRMLRPVHRQAVAAPPLTAATAGCAAPRTGLPGPRSAYAVPALQPVPVPGKETTPCPRRPHPRRARHAPCRPVRQRFRPGPARRGQTAPPHTAHPDQRHPHCPDRRGARPDRAGDLHRAERAGREAQLPGRPGAAVGRGRPAAGRHRRGPADGRRRNRPDHPAAAGHPPHPPRPPARPATPGGQPTAPGNKEQRPC